MEKYLIILIITIICYYIFRYCIQLEVEKLIKTKEGFADTINKSDSDLIKSITTLGQIATDLQTNGLKVPGNLNVTGTINTDNVITAKGAINASSLSVGSGTISTSGQINCGTVISSNLVASGRNILGELNSLRTGLNAVSSDLANYKGGMRLFTMILGQNKNTLVRDPWGNTYPCDNWVCCVQGVRSQWDKDRANTLQLFCHNINNQWHVVSTVATGHPTNRSGPIILAIPIRHFENNKVERMSNKHIHDWLNLPGIN